MSAASLLSIAGVITKDPDHDEYSSSVKYSMLSLGQEAVARLLNPKYLDDIKMIKTHLSITSPGTFTLETDFLKPIYFELSDGTPVRFLEVEKLGILRNEIEGGTDVQPAWYYYSNSGTRTGKILLDTYPITNAVQYYAQKPPTISGSQEPVLIGFDAQILQYFKHLFHMAEGQTDLATTAYSAFLKMLEPFMGN